MTNERSANPKVSEKDMLDVLSAIVGAADGEGAMDERDYEVVRAIRAAIEERGRLIWALKWWKQKTRYLLKSAKQVPGGDLEVSGYAQQTVMGLLENIRDFKLDGEGEPAPPAKGE